jgi:Putative prokaryotic signal transducing protein
MSITLTATILGGDQMSKPDDAREPITVFQTGDPGLLAVAQSLLESAEIEFFVAGAVVGGLFPGAVSRLGVPEIRVAAEDAAEAKELLKELA